jgi:ADP-heptose:LPS heptosyltransferase
MLFPGALGDLVLAMPALAALGARHPGARVTIAVNAWLRPLVVHAAVAHEVASLDDAGTAGLFGGTRVPSWFGERPILYAWMGAGDPAVQTELRARATSARFFSVVRGDGPEHAASAYARQAGVESETRSFRWARPSVSARLDALLEQTSGPVLVVHAGAGSPAKRWAAEGFREIARRWRQAGGEVVEPVGPADHGLAPIPYAHRAVEWPLLDVMALLGRACAYVGNDSGVSHLAGAAGARGVVVFGPTRARRWAPRGALVAIDAHDAFGSGVPDIAATSQAIWRALAPRLP